MKNYKTFIFDCDGVILNSNDIKTKSFKSTLIAYKKAAVEEFIYYHKNNGGISRYEKIKYFLKEIIPKYYGNYFVNQNEYNSLLQNFSAECKKYLFKSEVTKGLKELKDFAGSIPWLIVSGGDQNELREVFKFKNIDKYFNGGIYGSPKKKVDILKSEIDKKIIKFPALFFGDSKLDHLAAKSVNIDFVFVYKWTDFKDYNSYCSNNNLRSICSVSEIIELT